MNKERRGRKWTVNECLQLQREWELLGFTVDQISVKHKRTPLAIIYKLSEEGFADFNTVYYDYFFEKEKKQQNISNLTDCIEYVHNSSELDSDDSVNISTLSQVEFLQNQINELQKQLDNMSMNKTSKSSKSIFSSLF
jgi:hypothetical protein